MSHPSLVTEADRCVLCGLCLPHCPTYGLTRDEAESPRGRISLIKGWAEGRLEASPPLIEHLDHCLSCRNCEAACPAEVLYGALIDGARAAMKRQTSKSSWLANSFRRRAAARALRFYQTSGAQRLARRSGALRALGLARADISLPEVRLSRFKDFHPAIGAQRGRVALLTGCATEIFDADTLNAAIKTLTHCGFAVLVPAAQTCCGALHRHAGDLDNAERLSQENSRAFAIDDLDAVITVASGCGAHLREHTRLPVRDVSDFLHEAWPETLQPAPLAKRAVVQDPCTLRNALHSAEAPYALLRRIPGLQLAPLAGNKMCCGGAGDYMLRQPAMADALRAPKIEALSEAGADLLLTSNIGCALHLRAGIVQAGLTVEVLHPVTLLARQLPD